MFIYSCIFVIAGMLSAQSTKAPVAQGIELFPDRDSKEAVAETRSFTSREETSGKYIYQVFLHRKTGKPAFRAAVGTDQAKWWVYGPELEADLNGDGVPDVSWYGGDDVSVAYFVFLSSPKGYRQLDILETVARAWKKRNPKKPLELGENDGPSVTRMMMERTGHLMRLRVLIDDWSGERWKKWLRIPESEFMYRGEGCLPIQ